ncbi:histidine kinase [Chthoniobacter flavus Ellin428]|uniref:histidine kinase n=1 Tax=Chthoniobacter flavus Ellin428 TaxID=497964 RepID=B4DBD9_9BACT|nr:hybrid sensor histidine kinase/response regulator [Chthoniobacter flavus]EDY16229.1 histidine kinase [Chthoniobacter flavus Ellin428]TCO84383.1 phospho-acceptor domain-containing protein [Chthoniobacter flavus]
MDSDSINVLLIEDNEEHITFLRQLLATSAAGQFDLHTAGSVRSGIERLKDGGIELILLDLTLPDSDGLETFLRVIEAAPDLPLIVLSGLSDVALAIETVQLGAQDYLVKGHVDNHLLIRSMKYAIERKRAQMQLKRANDSLEVRVRERTEALVQTNARFQQEIAERKKAEEALIESNKQLSNALGQLQSTQSEIIQRERMHALGRMANGIAHDFNNALAPILGFSELLLMKPETLQDSKKVRNYIELIHTAAKDSAKVVSRLREFYRYRDEGDVFSPVVINDVVLQAISITQPRWKDQALAEGVNIDIRTEMGNVPTVPGNEAELREMVVNLIFNSIDAIPKRGTITIETETQGRWLAITVKDDGLGMSEEVKARCLEPFYSTKEDLGTGLGLGSVYGIVRRHEGEIDIQTEEGRGTSICVSLPLEKRSKPPEAPKPAAPPTNTLRILVVEDEPLVREVISVYLAEDQHDVTTAENGRVGLEKFKEGTFDLVMTDRAMPEMNGDQLAIEIKKLRPEQPIILLTGFGDLMAGSGEQPQGVDLVVSKPFTLATLRNAMVEVLGR